MNAEDMPIANEDRLNQEDCSKQKNQGDLYSQNGNYGMGHMSGGEIKDNAKVAGEINENNKNQSQNASNQVTINLNQQNKSNLPKTENNTGNNQKRVKASVKQGNTEYSAEASTVEEVIECFILLKKIFDVEVEDIEKGSIKFILKGSEEGLNRIVKFFQAGELAPILKKQFNLELESVKLIDSDSFDNYSNNQSQKLLSFTIAGDVSQADIDILKAALIDTSDDDKELKNQKKSRLIEEIKTQGAVKRNLVGAYLSGANLSDADLIGANLSGANLSDADLVGANLSDANLSGANLSGANLRGANLSGANLRGADLRGADFSVADLSVADLNNVMVENTLFSSDSLGMSESLKFKLQKQGAIFEDSPGDRSEVFSKI